MPAREVNNTNETKCPLKIAAFAIAFAAVLFLFWNAFNLDVSLNWFWIILALLIALIAGVIAIVASDMCVKAKVIT